MLESRSGIMTSIRAAYKVMALTGTDSHTLRCVDMKSCLRQALTRAFRALRREADEDPH